MDRQGAPGATIIVFDIDSIKNPLIESGKEAPITTHSAVREHSSIGWRVSLRARSAIDAGFPSNLLQGKGGRGGS